MNNILFKGVYSALSTPLRDDGSINEEAARKLMRWHIESGLNGFYICGATGEGVVLSTSARKQLAEIAVDEAKGKAVVINHVGAVDLVTANELAAHSAAIGVDAISSVPPFFYHYGLPEIRDYYMALTEVSGLPTLIYASPLAGTAFSPEMVESLMGIKGVIGLKWTSIDYISMYKIKQINKGNINVLNGPDDTFLFGLLMGADGGIGATYNVMPGLFADMYRAYSAGELEKTREIQLKINTLIDVLLEFGVLTGIKEILISIGYDMGHCTYPLKRFSEDERKAFFKRLEELQYSNNFAMSTASLTGESL